MRLTLTLLWVLLAGVRIEAALADASSLLATSGARLLLPIVADTSYKTDVTVHNGRDTSQDVLLAVIAEEFGSTDTVYSKTITLAPFSTTTLEEFAVAGHLPSGVGWIEVRGVLRDSSDADPAAKLRAVSRTYAPESVSGGTKSVVSQGIDLDAVQPSRNGTASGLRLDRDFGTTVAIINLEATASAFQITVSGPRGSIRRRYDLWPSSIVNIPFPYEDLGPVTVSVETDPATPRRWIALGSSFDYKTGDQWIRIATND